MRRATPETPSPSRSRPARPSDTARSFEQHCEYAYDPDTLEQWLREAGFARVECFGDRTLTPPGPDEQRMYFAAWKE